VIVVVVVCVVRSLQTRVDDLDQRNHGTTPTDRQTDTLKSHGAGFPIAPPPLGLNTLFWG